LRTLLPATPLSFSGVFVWIYNMTIAVDLFVLRTDADKSARSPR